MTEDRVQWEAEIIYEENYGHQIKISNCNLQNGGCTRWYFRFCCVENSYCHTLCATIAGVLDWILDLLTTHTDM
jgi:hypothetical protein